MDQPLDGILINPQMLTKLRVGSSTIKGPVARLFRMKQSMHDQFTRFVLVLWTVPDQFGSTHHFFSRLTQCPARSMGGLTRHPQVQQGGIKADHPTLDRWGLIKGSFAWGDHWETPKRDSYPLSSWGPKWNIVQPLDDFKAV